MLRYFQSFILKVNTSSVESLKNLEPLKEFAYINAILNWLENNAKFCTVNSLGKKSKQNMHSVSVLFYFMAISLLKLNTFLSSKICACNSSWNSKERKIIICSLIIVLTEKVYYAI